MPNESRKHTSEPPGAASGGKHAMKTSEREAWAAIKAGTTYPAVTKSKYRAKITEVDGIKFASKLEADRYKQLKLLKASGEICYFLRQVPFDLPGGAVYRCDFMVVYDCCEYLTSTETTQQIEFEDCKGFMTPISKLKIKQVEALYPVRIKILTRKDIGKCL
jgi:Protein of unknown function (DUF1064)